jgi:hypothetical protein
VLVQTVSPIAARAQEPAAAGEAAALQQLLDEQLRRIEALEARLAQLQKEVNDIRGPQFPGTPVPEHPLDEPFGHADDGLPPTNPDDESPNVDLPRAVNVDSYGSLRALAAADTDGHLEVLNNSSRLGIRGETRLFGDDFMGFRRYEMGINMVANDRAILLTSGDQNVSWSRTVIATHARALVDLLRAAWREYQRDYAKYFAGAMVCYAIVSLVPVLLLVVATLGLLLRVSAVAEAAEQRVLLTVRASARDESQYPRTSRASSRAMPRSVTAVRTAQSAGSSS